VAPEGTPVELAALMADCFLDPPEKRPTCSAIVEKLKAAMRLLATGVEAGPYGTLLGV
jgi:hypothetical protein